MKKIYFALSLAFVIVIQTVSGQVMNGQKMLSTTYENWNGSSWENSQRYLYTYDNNVFNTSYKYQAWTASAWKDAGQTTVYNDATGNPTLYVGQDWNTSVNPIWDLARINFRANKPT